MSSWKSDFFVQFRAFYINEFTRQKEVIDKFFISIRRIEIDKQA